MLEAERLAGQKVEWTQRVGRQEELQVAVEKEEVGKEGEEIKVNGEVGEKKKEEESEKEKKARMQLVKGDRVETRKEMVTSVGFFDEENVVKKWVCWPTPEHQSHSWENLD